MVSGIVVVVVVVVTQRTVSHGVCAVSGRTSSTRRSSGATSTSKSACAHVCRAATTVTRSFRRVVYVNLSSTFRQLQMVIVLPPMIPKLVKHTKVTKGVDEPLIVDFTFLTVRHGFCSCCLRNSAFGNHHRQSSREETDLERAHVQPRRRWRRADGGRVRGPRGVRQLGGRRRRGRRLERRA